MPSQHDLSRCSVVGGSDFGDGWIIQRRFVVPLSVEGDPAYGRPGLGQDAEFCVHGSQVWLPEVRVGFDLVHRWDDVRCLQQGREVIHHEVADTDRPHPASSKEVLQGTVGTDSQVEFGGQRLVQEQKIDLTNIELRALLSKACKVSS